LIRPDKHLRELIAHATPEQNARAIVKAKDYYTMCLRLGIEPTEAVRVLKEALEMEMSGNAADIGDAAKARDDLFTRRTYSGNYREP
jgi:hypothetical protein